MSTSLTADANLFSMIHALLDEQAPPGAAERRGGERRPFACAQLVAPYDGARLPLQTDFRLVHCQDISPTGFSFVAQERPEFEFLVVALGAVPFSFFSSQVMHARPTHSGAGAPYLVGCKFLNRLS